ncbi:MAG: ComF family protein [Clostridiales bacterium]|nr:ComF family protein [Clostridiales bacterium]
MNLVKKIVKLILNLFFPKRCAVCDDLLPAWNEYLCDSCRKKLIRIKAPFCMKCGKQLEDSQKEFCFDCNSKEHHFTRGRAVFEYRCIMDGIYRFKYSNRQEYAEFFAHEIKQVLLDELKNWKPDGIVPIPLHKSRLKKRGYNQAELIAEKLSEMTGIPLQNHLIIRERNTTPQKTLDYASRINNLKKAFKFVENDVKLNTIVIIDDIFTTGSTIDAVSLEIREKSNIKDIYFITVAIGKGL